MDIQDTAEPITELIEKGVTDVKHLIAKARGQQRQVSNSVNDPSEAHANAFHG